MIAAGGSTQEKILKVLGLLCVVVTGAIASAAWVDNRAEGAVNRAAVVTDLKAERTLVVYRLERVEEAVKELTVQIESLRKELRGNK